MTLNESSPKNTNGSHRKIILLAIVGIILTVLIFPIWPHIVVGRATIAHWIVSTPYDSAQDPLTQQCLNWKDEIGKNTRYQVSIDQADSKTVSLSCYGEWDEGINDSGWDLGFIWQMKVHIEQD